MDRNLTPRAARYVLSHGAAPVPVVVPAPGPADPPSVDPSFIDHAYPVLRGEPTIDDSQRANLWDLFHSVADANELAQHLQPLPLHPDLKQQLLIAKNKPSVKVDTTDKVLGAIQRLDPETLRIAEGHPAVLKMFVDLIENEK